MLYFFSEYNVRGNHAGTKARNDIEKILRKENAVPINRKILQLSEKNGSIKCNIKNRFDFIRYYWDLLFIRNRTVIIQYPMLSFDIDFQYIKKLSRKNRVVFLIHDIQSLRKMNKNGLEKEIKILNLADALIVHNCFMTQKIHELGIRQKQIYELECFDYLYDKETEAQRDKKAIIYAGNLKKSQFLEEMFRKNEHVEFNLYGDGWNEVLDEFKNANYQGSFLPDVVIEKLKGKFGLIWDGESVKGCTGVVGEYIKINNPHKMSLYIAAGIPVIVWNKAAVAKFVKQYNIGLIVESIDNLEEYILNISDEYYDEMMKNVKKLREKIVEGYFFEEVLKKIESDME